MRLYCHWWKVRLWYVPLSQRTSESCLWVFETGSTEAAHVNHIPACQIRIDDDFISSAFSFELDYPSSGRCRFATQIMIAKITKGDKKSTVVLRLTGENILLQLSMHARPAWGELESYLDRQQPKGNNSPPVG
jgi:hypothetical protein